MKEKTKEIMELHKMLTNSIGRGEKNVALAVKVLKAEIDAFNEMYFCGNKIRLNIVAAIMEQYLDAMKSQGVYVPDMVSDARALIASVFVFGGGGTMEE